MSNRRQFLATSARAGLAGCLAAPQVLIPVSPATAAEAKVTPDIVRMSSDIEPLVRLIEGTSREKCFDMMIEQLRRGLPYRQFLAALFLAGIRNVNPQPPGFKFHCVFVIHAAHQMSLDAPVEDRLLPLFWALDNFKVSQQQDVDQGDFHLKPVKGRLPSPSGAWKEFHAAMNDWDEEKADRSIVALVRSCGAHQIIEQLWQYGARDYRNIGHKAIFVANTWRTLQTIGWRHAEPVLRSLVLGLNDFGKNERVNDYAFLDQSYHHNVISASKNISLLRDDWTVSRPSRNAMESILGSIRSGRSEDACRVVLQHLQGRHAGGMEVWDAVHLAAGELMMQQPGIYGIHAVTSVSALRYAYETSVDPATRLLMLLQGVGWMCHFRNFMAGRPPGLADIKITEFEPVKTSPKPDEAAEEIFALIATDTPVAAAKAMSFAHNHPEPTAFAQIARRLIFRKGTDAHDYKYAASIFEDYHRVSPRWQPQMLATATYNLRGSTMPDSVIMRRAIEAIRTL